MYDIRGKVALVTGGGKGIGRAYCAALISEGAKVVIVDRDEVSGKELETLLNGRQAGSTAFVKCDVTNKEELTASLGAAVAKFGTLDILINNAGTVDETEEGWRKVVDLNLISLIESSRMAIDYLMKPGGVIVNTSSIDAHRQSSCPVYSATKAGVTAFSKSLGAPRAFGFTGVRVMAIQPGLTLTTLVTSGLSKVMWLKTDRKTDYIKNHLENDHVSQTPDAVAECLIHILKFGESGSVWTVIGGKWEEDVQWSDNSLKMDSI